MSCYCYLFVRVGPDKIDDVLSDLDRRVCKVDCLFFAGGAPCGRCCSVQEILEDTLWCEELFSHVAVVGGWVVFGEIVGVVEFTGAPVKTKLLLEFPVAELVEAHVHGLRALRLDLAVDDSLCRGIIGLNRCGGLLVAHFLEDETDVNALTRRDVEPPQFCLCC